MTESYHVPLDPDVLVRLIDRLDQYPVGLPDSPEIREFLSLFLTPDEALLASRFPLREATGAELAGLSGFDVDRTNELLEGMAGKGVVIDLSLGGGRYWFLTPSVIGFVEFSLMKLHAGVSMRRLAELLDRYSENDLYKEVFGSDTPITRALVGMEIPVTSRVVPWAQVERVVRDAGRGAIQTCYCRQKQRILDRPCSVASHEGTCVSLGVAADFVVRRGFGRAAGPDEILSLIRTLGERGLVHVTDNVRDRPSFVCNCCGCCCGLLGGVRKRLAKTAVAPSPLEIAVDGTLCTGCGLCTRTCQLGALGVEARRARVDRSLCLGCGACTRVCKARALSLVPRPGGATPPANALTKMVRIAWQKGRLWPLLKSALRRRVARFVLGR